MISEGVSAVILHKWTELPVCQGDTEKDTGGTYPGRSSADCFRLQQNWSEILLKWRVPGLNPTKLVHEAPR